jgi:hypothetical protein
MGGAPKAPTPVDPNVIINAQSQANRVNKITPFGSQVYTPNGLETQLDPQMQGLVDKQKTLAGTDMKQLKTPEGFGTLQNTLMQRLQSNASSPGPQKGNPQSMPNPAQMAQFSQIFSSLPNAQNSMTGEQQ